MNDRGDELAARAADALRLLAPSFLLSRAARATEGAHVEPA
jgi:hypothetical protein